MIKHWYFSAIFHIYAITHMIKVISTFVTIDVAGV